MILVNRKWDGNLAALDRPFEADDSGVDVVGPGNLHQLRDLKIRNIVLRFIPVGTIGGTDGAEADRLDPPLRAVVIKLRLLETGVQLHFDQGGLHPAEGQHRFQLRDCHVGHPDIPRQAHIVDALQLAPGCHKFRNGEGLGVRVAGVAVTSRRMVVGEGPVEEIGVDIVQLQIL